MKDEALKLALEAGFRVGPSREGPDDVWGVGANLERFAALVAAAERKDCAELCMDLHTLTDRAHNFYQFAANQILERGKA